ncbi:Uncharacterised protein [Mycobacteroides abscessus]|nr:Uncharacterised protein [Mycobacteroides abscessus]
MSRIVPSATRPETSSDRGPRTPASTGGGEAGGAWRATSSTDT